MCSLWRGSTVKVTLESGCPLVILGFRPFMSQSFPNAVIATKWPSHSWDAYIVKYSQGDLQHVSCSASHLFSYVFIWEVRDENGAGQLGFTTEQHSWDALNWPESWKERWKITAEILGLLRVPAPQLRQNSNCSYTCITRSEGISTFLIQGVCSCRVLTPSCI